MASGSHVDVNERRLRPIYDCLDNGNNKKAIQEADKALKKQKDLQCAKVLKALALLRLGRHDESSQLLEEIHSQHPSDEATLQAMAICYREVYKLEAIADLYENARKNCPDNEDILSALFMAYVRLGDYKKQQQTAMLLHRNQPSKNPYYFWAVMSIVMQAKSTSDQKLSKGMFLPLAERMVKKYVDEKKINAEAEVQLYLIILTLLEKWEDALSVVLGELGEKLTCEPLFQQEKLAEIYSNLKKWPEANKKYKSLLRENPDHWQYWKDYISTCLELQEMNWRADDESTSVEVDYTAEMVSAFIQSTTDTCTDGKVLRGPYLAKLELILQIKTKNGTVEESLGSPNDLLEEYFKLFGDKSCCFEDMKIFTSLLSHTEQTEIVETIKKTLQLRHPDGTINFPSNLKDMQRHISLMQLSRYLGVLEKLTLQEKLDLSKECLQRYHHGLDFGKDLLITDIQFSDNYLLLAAYFLIDLWKESGHQHYLLEAIIQLQKGSKLCPANFHFKVLLIRLFSNLGAYGPCHQIYESLEVKHIMNDTLGYLIANHIVRLGFLSTASSTYGTMLKFFAVNHKETAEYLIAGYKYGSFNKIFEFVRFREKLENSLQYASAKVESMLLNMILETTNHQRVEQMVTYMEVDPAEDTICFDEISDNRDLVLLESWMKRSCDIKPVIEFSFREEKAWLKVRNLTLRILTSAIMLGQQMGAGSKSMNNGVGNDKQTNHETLEFLEKSLSQYIGEIEGEFSQGYDYPLQGPSQTQLCRYLKDKHFLVVCSMTQEMLQLHKVNVEDLEHSENEKQESPVQKIPEILTNLVSKYRGTLIVEKDGKSAIDPSVLENLVLIAETLSHSAILAGTSHRILKPLKTSWNKRCRKKKSENPPPLPTVFSDFTHLVSRLESCAKDLHVAMRDLDPVLLSIDLSNLHLTQLFDSTESLNDSDTVRKDMLKSIETSYQTSSREVCELVHSKLQYFSSLKL